MKLIRPAAAALVVAVMSFVALPSRAADEGFEKLARSAGQGAPLFRIGLDSAHRLMVDSRGRYRVLDPATGEPVWKGEFTGELAVVADGGPQDSVESVYRIQTGAFASREAAETERDRLAGRYGAAAIVRHNPDRGTWRVRVGEAANRDALSSLMTRLH